jgi:hypothetical protein
MKQFSVAAIASLSILGLAAMGPVQAQVLSPVANPVLSPYLNLNRAGSSLSNNYYNLVRPQLQYNAAISSLEQQVQANRVAQTAAEPQGPVTTGHPVSFLNYRRYFLNFGTSSSFQNIQASGRALGAGNLPAGSGVGTSGTRSGFGSGGYGVSGGIGGGGGYGSAGGGFRPSY